MSRVWARLIAFAAISMVVVGASDAGAAQFRSFTLPSPLIADTSAPGGELESGRAAPKVNVLLPDGYRKRSRRGYPVLYLLHGAAGGTDTWIPGIAGLLKGFRGIVVMPDGGRFGMYVDWWNDGARGGPAWASYHLRVLRREIERRYPIRPGRRWHSIGGISMGGQGTLRYAAMLPGYFGSAVGFSAAAPDMQAPEAQLGVNALTLAGGGEGVTYDRVFGLPEGPWAEGNSPEALAPNFAHSRVYVTAGDGTNCPEDPINPDSIGLDTLTETMLHAQQAPFAAALREHGAKVTDVSTCGVHTFGVWDRAIRAAPAWGFFRPVPERPRRWTYRTIATRGEMWGFNFRFRKPPESVATFKRNGRRLAGAGTGRVWIQAGKRCRINVKLPFNRRLPRSCR